MHDAYYMTEERELIAQSARDFAENYIRPLADKIDKEDYFATELYKRAGELGFCDLHVPEEYGGNDLSLTDHMIIVEEMARVSPGFAMTFVADISICETLLVDLGTPEQKERWLPGMVKGEIIASHCTVEPCGLGNMEAYTGRAVPADGGWVLNATKSWSTNVGAAQLNIVKAWTDTPGEFSYFLVPLDSEGVLVSPPEDKVGWRGSNTGEVVFKDVFVPNSDVLGPIGKSVDLGIQSVFNEMIGTGSVALGITEESNAITQRYISTRMHNSGVPFPFRYDVMRVRFAENMAREDAIRGMAYPAALAYDAGARNMDRAFLIKAYCFEMAERVASTNIELCGGVGTVRGTGLERLWRDAKMGLIGGGQRDYLYSMAGAIRLSGRG
ncbi:acyl-CoA dehydrogenase family protein [Adlercreutzia sp. ZJ473]|uniref:acyl-CoA dehydrogenase family protein n=1 Tax=Adlercreutzia sp. ZJ473 TaxID=2722822 RepID=UPI001556C052|nr:acyl-CoA dehydrogenase family protein [Adlercreutzia sp. ZJ473]